MNPLHSVITFVLLFIPFVCYVWLKRTHSHKTGLVASLILTLIVCGLIHIFFAGLEAPLLAAVAVIIVLSVISFTTNNALYFKLEPAIKSLITSGFLLIFLVLGDSVSLQILTSVTSSELLGSSPAPAGIQDLIQSPEFMFMIESFEKHLIFWGFIYAGWMTYVAFHYSDIFWLIAKGAYIICLLLPTALTTYIHLYHLI